MPRQISNKFWSFSLNLFITVFIHLSRGLTPRLCCPSSGGLVLAVGRSSYLQFDIVYCRPPATLLPLTCDAATVSRHSQGQISAVSPDSPGSCCCDAATGTWRGASGGRAHVSGVGLSLGDTRKPCPVPLCATCCAWVEQGRDHGPSANAWRSHGSHAQCRELVPQ